MQLTLGEMLYRFRLERDVEAQQVCHGICSSSTISNFEDTFFLENIIYNELISRGYEVFTGKTYKGEVDFVVIDGRRKCFIQVAYYICKDNRLLIESLGHLVQ